MFRIPKHIGIIPDGNRRWATQNGKSKSEGYQYGLAPGLNVLRTAQKYGVRELTYYGFTVDNCKRPKEQVTAFQTACVHAVKLMEQENVTICVVGNTQSSCFPDVLLPYTTPPTTPDQDKMKVNLLINYGWKWDLQNDWASRFIPRMDLIIRWGGMCRLSGFLPIQSVYSDFYIVKELWPDYKKEQFDAALAWYQKQDVTLGG